VAAHRCEVIPGREVHDECGRAARATEGDGERTGAQWRPCGRVQGESRAFFSRDLPDCKRQEEGGSAASRPGQRETHLWERWKQPIRRGLVMVHRVILALAASSIAELRQMVPLFPPGRLTLVGIHWSAQLCLRGEDLARLTFPALLPPPASAPHDAQASRTCAARRGACGRGLHTSGEPISAPST
jgi:hypothetical protein